jgi:hypothetical protein
MLEEVSFTDGRIMHRGTHLQVAEFLGWTKKGGKEPDFKCQVAFKCLEALEADVVKLSNLKGARWAIESASGGDGHHPLVAPSDSHSETHFGIRTHRTFNFGFSDSPLSHDLRPGRCLTP